LLPDRRRDPAAALAKLVVRILVAVMRSANTRATHGRCAAAAWPPRSNGLRGAAQVVNNATERLFLALLFGVNFVAYVDPARANVCCAAAPAASVLARATPPREAPSMARRERDACQRLCNNVVELVRIDLRAF
jgi:hypothetical protein